MVGDSKPLGGICRKCCLEVTADTTIRLWDGKDYCEKCVEDACPGLAEYARTHETLEEEMPNWAWRVAVHIAVVSMVGMLGLGILLWLIGIWCGVDPMGEEGLALLLFFPVGGVPFAIVFAVASVVGFAIHRPRVALHEGRLSVTLGSTTFSLSECEWYIGRTWHMSYPRFMSRKMGMLQDRALVIILPRCAARYERSRLVATGFTEETRQRWQSFLTLAAVPRRTSRLPRGSSA